MESITAIIVAFVAAMGIPSAITGFVFRRLEKKMDVKEEERRKDEAIRAEKEANTEKLMLMIMQTSRATAILSEATAKAVQRIPDAKCNGDMTAALELASKIQKEEKDFMFDQGIKHIFGE